MSWNKLDVCCREYMIGTYKKKNFSISKHDQKLSKGQIDTCDKSKEMGVD